MREIIERSKQKKLTNQQPYNGHNEYQKQLYDTLAIYTLSYNIGTLPTSEHREKTVDNV